MIQQWKLENKCHNCIWTKFVGTFSILRYKLFKFFDTSKCQYLNDLQRKLEHSFIFLSGTSRPLIICITRPHLTNFFVNFTSLWLSNIKAPVTVRDLIFSNCIPQELWLQLSNTKLFSKVNISTKSRTNFLKSIKNSFF